MLPVARKDNQILDFRVANGSEEVGYDMIEMVKDDVSLWREVGPIQSVEP